jgi:hypothetical protein
VLDRQRGRIVFECDGCTDTLETGEADFEAARTELRSAGWIARSEAGVWCHYCEDCKSG